MERLKTHPAHEMREETRRHTVRTKARTGFVTAVAGVVGSSAVALMLMSLYGCEKHTGPMDKVVLGAEASMLPAAVWVAEGKGYFREEGLDVTIKEFDSGRLSFLAMLEDGSVDISTVAPTPIMFSSFARQDFSILATFVYSDEDVKVIARRDKGITTAKDLRGKKVGTPAGTTGQFFLQAFLTFNKLRATEVEMIDVGPSDLPAALQSGRVDAIVIWEPHAHRAQQLLGDRALRLPSSPVYRETFNFMVMRDFARDNPRALRKFLRAADEATTFVRDHPEESQALVAERLNLDREVTAALWGDFVFGISLDQSLILTLEDEARWAIASGLAGEKAKVPNYLDYIHVDALEDVKPEAVTVIR